jgi:hypothetical protein
MVVLSWSHTAFSLKEVEGRGRKRKEEEGRGRGGEGRGREGKALVYAPRRAVDGRQMLQDLHAHRALTQHAQYTLQFVLFSLTLSSQSQFSLTKFLNWVPAIWRIWGNDGDRGTGEQGVRGGSSGGRVDEAAQRRDGREAAGRHVIGAGERSVRSVDGLSQQK